MVNRIRTSREFYRRNLSGILLNIKEPIIYPFLNIKDLWQSLQDSLDIKYNEITSRLLLCFFFTFPVLLFI